MKNIYDNSTCSCEADKPYDISYQDCS